MTFEEFEKATNFSLEEISRGLIRNNKNSIQIKKEAVAVKNLVKIVKSTLKLSSKKGFQNMTLRDLCKDSGLSMGALYSYFSSKGELLDLLHDQGQQTVMNVMHDFLEPLTDVQERLHMAIRTHIYLSESMYSWFSFFFMETKNLSPKNRKKPVELELATERIYLDILKEGKKQKIFAIENPEMIAAMIKALMQDWYLKHWKYSKRKVSVEDYADFVIKTVECMCSENPARTKRVKVSV